MARETERKFLVNEFWNATSHHGERFVQGYLCADSQRTVRVRTEADRAVITIKGETVEITRAEFEYAIPYDDARELLALCLHPPIEKVRYRVDVGDSLWEVDVFDGSNKGLVIAEIELTSENAAFARPSWVGDEVTGDPRYGNSRLAAHPFSIWEPPA